MDSDYACLCSFRRCASVILHIYGRVTYPLGLSFSVERLKNCPTSSSGDDGMRVLEVKSLVICLTILSGYPNMHVCLAVFALCV